MPARGACFYSFLFCRPSVCQTAHPFLFFPPLTSLREREHNSFKSGLVTKSALIFLYYSYVYSRHIWRGLSEFFAKPIRSKKKISVHRVICVVARQTTMAIHPSSDSMPLKSRAPMDLCSTALDISPTTLLSNCRQQRSSRSHTPPSV